MRRAWYTRPPKDWRQDVNGQRAFFLQRTRHQAEKMRSDGNYLYR